MKLNEVEKRCKMCWCVLSEPFNSSRCASCEKLKFFNTTREASTIQKRWRGPPKLITRNLPSSSLGLR